MAITGFIVGLISLLVTTIALVVSINIYNATGDYRGIKRHRLKSALRVYLRRTDHSSKKKRFANERGFLRAWHIFRAWSLSYYLLLFPFRINSFIDKQQKKELKRREKNKWHSSRLADYGFAGVISFARNDENDDYENFLYKAVSKYLEKDNYAALTLFIKFNISAESSKVGKEIIKLIIERFWGIQENQNQLAGILLYLHWYRIVVLKEEFPHPHESNIFSVYENYNKKEFYEYFKKEYGENMIKAYYVKNNFGGSAYLGDTRDDKVINFLMLVKYMYFYSNIGVGSEMRDYINAMMQGEDDMQSIIEYTEKVYKEQLELVGGNNEMTPFIINYIKPYKN
ncbi:MAG: hypothetical protein FWD58_00315 [Firmicutes bacterium]|nr:hypothetical protein [Bacillota bacterium]